ncbi:hypothetical protein HK097_004347 [Rhizophlyctis rosea]|uniref:Amidase domain-containing protein n=1 Tax=Rhizophlyctis rosea TaxID=64517 RepID=A0AAD5SK42_9FUNG|nr:hypothetical protein HK097_004347 [Rhizophlyctis rosea]
MPSKETTASGGLELEAFTKLELASIPTGPLSDTDLAFSSATTLAHLICTRRITSTQILEIYLSRISCYNERLNAIVTLDISTARSFAKQCDEAVQSSTKPLGPLHGVPFTIKDAFATKGLRTTSGMMERKDHVPDWDAVVVERLKAAGAVLMGKTNVPREITGQETVSECLGRCRNPWDLERTSGASSGGAAVAVSAGLCGFEVGSDSGGSIRQPSHCCGIYGHFSTHSLVAPRGHLPSVDKDQPEKNPDLLSIGPMARSPSDLALILDIIRGPDPLLPYLQGPTLLPHTPKPLSEHRVAIWMEDTTYPLGVPIRAAFTSLIRNLTPHLKSLSTTARPPFTFTDAARTAFQLWVASSSASTPPEKLNKLRKIRNDSEESHKPYTVLHANSELLRHGDYLRLDTHRQSISLKFSQFFKEYDILLCPVIPTTAFPHDTQSFTNPDCVSSVDHRLSKTLTVNGEEVPYVNQLLWPSIVGMCGLPSAVIPIAEEGLPVGIQVVGPKGGDLATIWFAELVRGVVGGYRRPPGYED